MSLKEYKELIKLIDEKEKEYLDTRRQFDEEEFEILTTFDFKKEYGKDNEKIRKAHIRNELSILSDKKDNLKLEIDKLQRHKTLLELEILYGGE